MQNILKISTALLAFALAVPVVVAEQPQSIAPLQAVAASNAEQPVAKKETDDKDESAETKDDDEEYEDLNAKKATPVDPHTAAMLALAQQSGCLACHKIERKLVGPAWADVAQRYKSDPAARTKLIEKVSRGGGGNWTEVTGGMRMPPYGEKVARENIATLVDFILSLPPQ